MILETHPDETALFNNQITLPGTMLLSTVCLPQVVLIVLFIKSNKMLGFVHLSTIWRVDP